MKRRASGTTLIEVLIALVVLVIGLTAATASIVSASRSTSTGMHVEQASTMAQSLLTTLRAAAITNGDVYTSIIPFSKNVNVGASNYNANWIDWTAWDAANPSSGSNSNSGTINYGNGTFCNPLLEKALQLAAQFIPVI